MYLCMECQECMGVKLGRLRGGDGWIGTQSGRGAVKVESERSQWWCPQWTPVPLSGPSAVVYYGPRLEAYSHLPLGGQPLGQCDREQVIGATLGLHACVQGPTHAGGGVTGSAHQGEGHHILESSPGQLSGESRCAAQSPGPTTSTDPPW